MGIMYPLSLLQLLLYPPFLSSSFFPPLPFPLPFPLLPPFPPLNMPKLFLPYNKLMQP